MLQQSSLKKMQCDSLSRIYRVRKWFNCWLKLVERIWLVANLRVNDIDLLSPRLRINNQKIWALKFFRVVIRSNEHTNIPRRNNTSYSVLTCPRERRPGSLRPGIQVPECIFEVRTMHNSVNKWIQRWEKRNWLALPVHRGTSSLPGHTRWHQGSVHIEKWR